MPITVFGRWAAPAPLSAAIPKSTSKAPTSKAPVTKAGTTASTAAAKATLTAASAPKKVTTTINKVPATVTPTMPAISTVQKPVVATTTATKAVTQGMTATLPGTTSQAPQPSTAQSAIVQQTKPATTSKATTILADKFNEALEISGKNIKPLNATVAAPGKKDEEQVKPTSTVAAMLQSANQVNVKPSSGFVKLSEGSVAAPSSMKPPSSADKPVPSFTVAPTIMQVLEKTPTTTATQLAPVVAKPVSSYDVSITAAGGKSYSAGASAPASVMAAQSATPMFTEQVSAMGTGASPVFGQKESFVTTQMPVLPAIAQPSVTVKPAAPVAAIPVGSSGATATTAAPLTAVPASGPMGPLPTTATTVPVAKPAADPGSKSKWMLGLGVAAAIAFAFSRGSR